MQVWLDHNGKIVPNKISFKIKEFYEQVNGNYLKLVPLLMKEFNWNEQQCYIATEHLYRPRNYN